MSAPAESTFLALQAALATAPAVLVQVVRTQGSVPREAGTWMAVLRNGLLGTIGGGHLEHEAVVTARAALDGAPLPAERRCALGPTLGQCCGGVVHLRFERVEPAGAAALLQRLRADDAAQRMPVALFGGGHTGQALVRALAPLPVSLHWIDSRDEIFPAALPPQVHAEHSDPVQAAVKDLAAGTHVLVMSFSHAEDLEIVAACLQRLRTRGDLPFVGLIGSRSKWATFRHRLEERGFTAEELSRITCPIGVPGVRGKEPAVIAAAVAAQLMTLRAVPAAAAS